MDEALSDHELRLVEDVFMRDSTAVRAGQLASILGRKVRVLPVNAEGGRRIDRTMIDMSQPRPSMNHVVGGPFLSDVWVWVRETSRDASSIDLEAISFVSSRSTTGTHRP